MKKNTYQKRLWTYRHLKCGDIHISLAEKTRIIGNRISLNLWKTFKNAGKIVGILPVITSEIWQGMAVISQKLSIS